MNKRIKKKLDNIRSGLFQPFFRKMAGWNEIEEQIDTLHYFLNNTVDITTLPKATGLLRKVQLVDTEVLRIVLQILQKNRIDCWLDYGTLLGAVRHKGFIPWDDDLDVAIKRSDFEKVVTVLNDELPSCFEYGVTNMGRIWISIWNAGVILDIFPMDCVAADSVSDCNELKAKVFAYRRYYSKHRNKSNAILMKKRDEIIGKADYNSPIWYHSVEFLGGGTVFCDSAIFPLAKLEFEGYEFFVPNSYQEYLSQLYGDNYMNLPQNGVLHHSGGNNKGIYYNSIKSGIDIDELLVSLKAINP